MVCGKAHTAQAVRELKEKEEAGRAPANVEVRLNAARSRVVLLDHGRLPEREIPSPRRALAPIRPSPSQPCPNAVFDTAEVHTAQMPQCQSPPSRCPLLSVRFRALRTRQAIKIPVVRESLRQDSCSSQIAPTDHMGKSVRRQLTK